MKLTSTSLLLLSAMTSVVVVCSSQQKAQASNLSESEGVAQRSPASATRVTTNKMKILRDFERASQAVAWNGPQVFCGSMFGTFFYRYDLNEGREAVQALYSSMADTLESSVWIGDGAPILATNTPTRKKVYSKLEQDAWGTRRTHYLMDSTRVACRDLEGPGPVYCFNPLTKGGIGGSDLVCDSSWERVKKAVIAHPYSLVD